jgi:hypothetical protein
MTNKYCKDCKWSITVKDEWNLHCINPAVNGDDPWALAGAKMNGTSCRSQREIRWFAVCGIKGKKFEERKA